MKQRKKNQTLYTSVPALIILLLLALGMVIFVFATTPSNSTDNPARAAYPYVPPIDAHQVNQNASSPGNSQATNNQNPEDRTLNPTFTPTPTSTFGATPTATPPADLFMPILSPWEVPLHWIQYYNQNVQTYFRHLFGQ